MVQPIPEGFTAITPHLVVHDAAAALEFYTKVLGAEEISRSPAPDGKKLMHVELSVQGARFMLCDDFPEYAGGVERSAKAIGRSPVTIHVYTEDTDAVVKAAEELGATVTMPVADMFWGDRFGKFTDPFGHDWSVSTRIRDMTDEEVEAAAAEAFGDPD